MPTKSEKQRRLFQAVAHNPKLARAKGIPQRVAREFLAADKSKKSKR